MRTAQHVGDLGIVVGDAGGGLDHEEDHISLVDGYLHLAADGGLEDIIRIRSITSGVHHRKLAPVPVGLAIVAVPGNTCGIVHNRLAHTYQAVEEGAFADVRPAYYCY